MKYNIIGDIHGRTNWKSFVKDDCVNIFTGDYFSPYNYIKFDDLKNNFMDIVMYKVSHPETVLLLGNHDEDHWHIHEHASRYDKIHEKDIADLFEENSDMLQYAYSIENKILVTHAGVSSQWYWYNILNPEAFERTFSGARYSCGRLFELYYEEYADDIDKALTNLRDSIRRNMYLNKEFDFKNGDGFIRKGSYYIKTDNGLEHIKDINPNIIANEINESQKRGEFHKYEFRSHASSDDYYGTSMTHGPLWIRTYPLTDHNIFYGTNYAQVFGHTRMNNLTKALSPDIRLKDKNDLYCVDCLGDANPSSLEIDINNNEINIISNVVEEKVQF